MNKDIELEALIYGKKIGELLYYQNRIYFEYDTKFLKENIEISPLKLDTKKTKGAYTNLDNFDLYQGLAGVFFDLLPDIHGMPFIDRYFEAKGYKASDITLLHKLAFIGDRGLGAIEFKPKEEAKNYDIDEILSVKDAYEDMKTILENKNSIYSVAKLMNILNSASSIGGARPKILITYNHLSNQIKYNNKKLDSGYKRAIIKFDEIYPNSKLIDESLDDTKLEYLFMKSAKNCGINIPNIYLYKEKIGTHLILERFDRDEADKKIHISTASALMHKDISVPKVMSYEELFAFTNKICKKQSTIEELFRRMVFNILILNYDDHAKNFSFIMSKNGSWDLSPAYDITYSKGRLQEHLTTINGKGKNILVEDMLNLAKKNLIDEKFVLETIKNIKDELSLFETKAKELGIKEENYINICEDIKNKIRSF
ncbi:type II toxin-antitoxin system HipA family toxin [Arcobacter vandammei]|uniref:type II toxin-antitoxin system HipA family toxin n=1 Tax=Arcobacter vandammei TaxID=2782243 RepID=UPI0018DFB5C0|nr:HipA domain-containing protein [Arcobacter vandammei]